jgi:hypothetical protein
LAATAGNIDGNASEDFKYHDWMQHEGFEYQVDGNKNGEERENQMNIKCLINKKHKHKKCIVQTLVVIDWSKTKLLPVSFKFKNLLYISIYRYRRHNHLITKNEQTEA